jgi:hypothetical protein
MLLETDRPSLPKFQYTMRMLSEIQCVKKHHAVPNAVKVQNIITLWMNALYACYIRVIVTAAGPVKPSSL